MLMVYVRYVFLVIYYKFHNIFIIQIFGGYILEKLTSILCIMYICIFRLEKGTALFLNVGS